MARLIDAEELIEVAHRVRLDSRERIERMIESAPTVDAGPVVRCIDCKWSEWWGPEGREALVCIRLDVPYVTPDFYCAWGERKEDGTD